MLYGRKTHIEPVEVSLGERITEIIVDEVL